LYRGGSMTLEEIAALPKETLNISEIAPILNSDPQDMRVQIKDDRKHNRNSFGFPVIMIGSRIKIPKRPFLKVMGLDV